MSSDFYSSGLSRNLVRTGTADYRENAALHQSMATASRSTVNRHGDFSAHASFTAFPSFGLIADMTQKTVSAGRISLSKPALPFEINPHLP